MAAGQWHEEEDMHAGRDEGRARGSEEQRTRGPLGNQRGPDMWRGPQGGGQRGPEMEGQGGYAGPRGAGHGGDHVGSGAQSYSASQGAGGFGHAGYGAGGYVGYGSDAQQSQFAQHPGRGRVRHGGQQGGYGGHGGQQGGYGSFGEHTRDTQPWMDNGYGGQEHGGGSGYGQPRAYGGSHQGGGAPGRYADQGGYGAEQGGPDRGGERYGRFGGQSSYGGFGSPASYGSQGWSQGGSMAGRQRRGPKGYTRSDERIRDDICDHLMRSDLDVEDVSVRVEKGHVTLEGTVPHRSMRHRLEDIVDGCMGVQEIDNLVRVRRPGRSDEDLRESASPGAPDRSDP